MVEAIVGETRKLGFSMNLIRLSPSVTFKSIQNFGIRNNFESVLPHLLPLCRKSVLHAGRGVSYDVESKCAGKL